MRFNEAGYQQGLINVLLLLLLLLQQLDLCRYPVGTTN
jgi:hypothetical protein